jgi:predicted nucleic acid-binding protein
MNYLVETIETERRYKYYGVEAESEEEAKKIVEEWDDSKMSFYSDDYIDTINIEITKIKPDE